MGNGRETDLRHVTRACINALAVPNRLAGLGEQIGEKPASICGCEYSSIAPFITTQRPDIQDINLKNVAGLGAGNLDWPDQMVAWRQITVAHICGIVVI